MDAKELRIGNIVNYFGKNQIVTSDIIRECELNNATTQPIHLIEEWLLKFGFSEHYGSFRIKLDNSYLCTSLQFNDPYITNGDEPIYYFNKTFYVHQLQNLYFALTGTELEITKA